MSVYAKARAALGGASAKRKKGPSSSKAAKMLRDGEVRGKPLTKKQRGFMGARAGGY